MKTPKPTRQERDAAAAAEARSSRIAEFKSGFLRDQGRRVYTREACWEAEKAGDKSGFAAYNLVDEFERLSAQLRRELLGLQSDAADAIARLADGRDPFTSSNGICARYYEADKYGHQLETLRSAIAALARATGWRVREIESTSARAKADAYQGLAVVASGGGWAVRQAVDVVDGVVVPARLEARGDIPHGYRWLGLHDGQPRFEDNGIVYESEELAWAALALVVTGRAL